MVECSGAFYGRFCEARLIPTVRTSREICGSSDYGERGGVFSYSGMCEDPACSRVGCERGSPMGRRLPGACPRRAPAPRAPGAQTWRLLGWAQQLGARPAAGWRGPAPPAARPRCPEQVPALAGGECPPPAQLCAADGEPPREQGGEASRQTDEHQRTNPCPITHVAPPKPTCYRTHSARGAAEHPRALLAYNPGVAEKRR